MLSGVAAYSLKPFDPAQGDITSKRTPYFLPLISPLLFSENEGRSYYSYRQKLNPIAPNRVE